jgi:hypothetical protein
MLIHERTLISIIVPTAQMEQIQPEVIRGSKKFSGPEVIEQTR